MEIRKKGYDEFYVNNDFMMATYHDLLKGILAISLCQHIKERAADILYTFTQSSGALSFSNFKDRSLFAFMMSITASA